MKFLKDVVIYKGPKVKLTRPFYIKIYVGSYICWTAVKLWNVKTRLNFSSHAYPSERLQTQILNYLCYFCLHKFIAYCNHFFYFVSSGQLTFMWFPFIQLPPYLKGALDKRLQKKMPALQYSPNIQYIIYLKEYSIEKKVQRENQKFLNLMWFVT